MNKLLLIAIVLSSLSAFAEDGYPIELRKGFDGGIMDLIGLDALGGYFLTIAAIVAIVSALKSFALDKDPKGAVWRLAISIVFIAIVLAA